MELCVLSRLLCEKVLLKVSVFIYKEVVPANIPSLLESDRSPTSPQVCEITLPKREIDC